ncbi:hypothetical protein GJ496_006087 [Pomphorhynchus laevis]|nr:hypothetical protein GJ496_006087 [Pomphorhynchus laevis]
MNNLIISLCKTKTINWTLPLRGLSNQLKTTPRVLITGGHGQLGGTLARTLRGKHGKDNVILTDIVKPSQAISSDGIYRYLDILDSSTLNKTIVDNKIDWVVHFSALLSAIAESNVQKAIDINVTGLINILQASTKHKCRLFIPSTIGAFGPDSPLDFTPNTCIQRPNTIYGVTKVFAELLGEYYNHRFGLDFRCLRLPGIISADSQPGGGTTDYAVDVFHQIKENGHYECYLRPDTTLPMMYIDDCIRAMIEFLEVAPDAVKRRVYNIAAVSFSPEELFSEIKSRYPDAKFAYKPDKRQKIGNLSLFNLKLDDMPDEQQ